VSQLRGTRLDSNRHPSNPTNAARASYNVLNTSSSDDPSSGGGTTKNRTIERIRDEATGADPDTVALRATVPAFFPQLHPIGDFHRPTLDRPAVPTLTGNGTRFLNRPEHLRLERRVLRWNREPPPGTRRNDLTLRRKPSLLAGYRRSFPTVARHDPSLRVHR
jgi:hypothetical protein